MTEITTIDIKKLTLPKNNPRSINQESMSKLCNSIKQDPDFLSVRPILINKIEDTYNVYAGNQRVRAAKKLGWKQIPCIIENDLSEEIIKDRIIKDNLHSGSWDYDILANEFDIEKLLDLGFTTDQLHLDIDDISEKSLDEEEASEECPHKCEACGQKIKLKK